MEDISSTYLVVRSMNSIPFFETASKILFSTSSKGLDGCEIQFTSKKDAPKCLKRVSNILMKCAFTWKKLIPLSQMVIIRLPFSKKKTNFQSLQIAWTCIEDLLLILQKVVLLDVFEEKLSVLGKL